VEFSEAHSRRPHLKHTKHRSNDVFEEEVLKTGVRGTSTTVSTLLFPFLQEIWQSHIKQVFSGFPADNSEWRKSWESFVGAAMAASGGQGLPDIAMLRVLEGWLDKATKHSMHHKIKDKPALLYSDLRLEFCREFQVESHVTNRKKLRVPHSNTRRVNLHLQRGETSRQRCPTACQE